MAGYVPRVCDHGHVSTCPEDRLAQVRLRWGSGTDPRGADDDWRTVTVWACDAQGWRDGSWRSVWNRRNHETRVVRVGAA